MVFKFKRIPILVVTAAFLLASISTSAYAKTGVTRNVQDGPKLLKEQQLNQLEKIEKAVDSKGRKIFQITENDGNGNFSFDPIEGIDKSIVLDALNQFKAQEDGTLYSLSDSNSIAGPQEGYQVSTEFQTSAWVPDTGASDDTIDFYGNSKNLWNGFEPYNAEKINASDTFSYSWVGAGAQINVSYPMSAGGSIQKSSSSATLSYPEKANSYVYPHYYNGISGKAWNIYKAKQVSATTFLIGGATYSTFAEEEVEVFN